MSTVCMIIRGDHFTPGRRAAHFFEWEGGFDDVVKVARETAASLGRPHQSIWAWNRHPSAKLQLTGAIVECLYFYEGEGEPTPDPSPEEEALCERAQAASCAVARMSPAERRRAILR